MTFAIGASSQLVTEPAVLVVTTVELAQQGEYFVRLFNVAQAAAALEHL